MTATRNIPTLQQVINDVTVFAPTFLRILDKEKRLVPLRYNRMQRHSLQHETRRTLKVKMRQGTMSTMEQSKLFWLATTRTITSLTLANKDDTTQAMRRMTDRFYEKLPEPFPRPQRNYANDRITTYGDTDSECIIATAGGVDIGHSLTISHAHLTEVSRWRDPDTVMQGVLQAIPASGRVVAESTPNGQSGWFYDTCMETISSQGRNGWSLQFYPWWWAEDYVIPLAPGERLDYTEEELRLIDLHDLTAAQIKFRRQKMIDEKGKFQESYPEDINACFLSSDGTSVFHDVREIADARSYKDWMDFVEGRPDLAPHFVMGVDWGRENDYSVFTVIHVPTWTVVAVERYRHVDWHIQRAYLTTLARRWQCERIVVESNSMGGPNISELTRDDLPVQSFFTSEKSKKMIIDNLILAIEQRDLHLLPDTGRESIGAVVINELMSYQQIKTSSGNYKYEGKPHDDCVMSLAFALFAVKQSGAY